MIKGKLFGVGVGPGDKELITLKALNILKSSDVIAIPVMKNNQKAAFNVVKDYIKDKPIINCDMPMCKDFESLNQNYIRIADVLEFRLKNAENVAFITLGDPTIYSTFININSIILQRGYETEIIPGVTSFCAAASKLNIPLCTRNEPLVILPASYNDKIEEYLNLSGTKVIMKSNSNISKIIDIIEDKGLKDKTYMVERCGMENEKIYTDFSDFNRNSSYFSIIIIKDKN